MENFAKQVKEYWFIIVFIGMVIVSWTTFDNRLKEVEKRVENIENAITTFDQVRIDIAIIKTKLDAIEKKL